MVNYQNSKIYKLYSPSKNIIYIGSTTQPLCKRLALHLSDYKMYNNNNSKKYYTSFLVLDCEDYKIELLEDYSCNNRQQLEKKEGEYIKTNECVNKNITGRTLQEYYNDNIDKIKELKKKYNITNANKISEYNKEYRTTNLDKVNNQQKQWKIDNIDKVKQYRIDNIDKRKQYLIDNADKIRQQSKLYMREYRLKKKVEIN